MKILLLTISFVFSLQCSISASWYGCAEYTPQELEKMSEDDLMEVLSKNIELSKEIYEDAAVKSILDKKMYKFRSQQYADCIKYNQEIEFFLKNIASERIDDEQ
jgi:hypothetical protein